MVLQHFRLLLILNILFLNTYLQSLCAWVGNLCHGVCVEVIRQLAG